MKSERMRGICYLGASIALYVISLAAINIAKAYYIYKKANHKG